MARPGGANRSARADAATDQRRFFTRVDLAALVVDVRAVARGALRDGRTAVDGRLVGDLAMRRTLPARIDGDGLRLRTVARTGRVRPRVLEVVRRRDFFIRLSAT